MLSPLCAVVAQSAVTLLVLPSLTNQELTIPLIQRHIPIQVPWSADEDLAPLNAGIIELAKLGTSWTFLEQVAGVIVGDTIPPGYLIPSIAHTNNTVGSQYPTDIAHIQCECHWVAPTLPSPPTTTNVSHIQVSLDSFGIKAMQAGPQGMAGGLSVCIYCIVLPHSHVPKCLHHFPI